MEDETVPEPPPNVKVSLSVVTVAGTVDAVTVTEPTTTAEGATEAGGHVLCPTDGVVLLHEIVGAVCGILDHELSEDIGDRNCCVVEGDSCCEVGDGGCSEIGDL